MEVSEFLSKQEEQQVVEAIREAEGHTSGEIRVHFERNLDKEPMKRAEEVFCYLRMDRTEKKNGVLFYVAVDDHQFAVLGDHGIDEVVPDDFWESIRDEVIAEFRVGKHAKGLVAGILHAGEKLKEFFPVEGDHKNELPDQISKNHD